MAALLALLANASPGQNTSEGYTNFIRQVQLPYEPSRTTRDVYVSQSGGRESPLEINPGGARFELHTVKATPLTSYLLDTKYVGTYIPIAQVVIRSEDPYTAIPRTRADRPFHVDITMDGLRNGDDDPAASKQVKILRHVQSYGTGDGTTVDRSQATLENQSVLTTNGTTTLSYPVTSIPGADLTKIRGEERFSVFSLDDYQAPSSQLASMFVQVWPVAYGSISGITNGQTIQFSAPTLTIAANDLYPGSTVYTQIYKGDQALGTTGTILHDASEILSSYTVPQNRLFTVSSWDHAITGDGTWTVELLTSTPFGVDRLGWVSFNVDRTITVNGSVTTIE